MTDYWPDGIDVNDTESPLDILNAAKENWEDNSEAVLTLELQKTESQGGYAMIIVHAKHVPSNRTANLFSVYYRKSTPYPVNIKPKGEDLPNLFKRSYLTSGLFESPIDAAISGREVENKWLSETPSDFRDKLSDVLNLPFTKAEAWSLIVGSPQEKNPNEPSDNN